MTEKKGLAIVMFSGDKDRVFSALMIANGALSMGRPVSIFFTLWGFSVLRKKGPQAKGKLLAQKLFGWLLPKGVKRLPLSRLNFLGIGSFLMDYLIKKNNVASIPDLLKNLKEGGATFYICSTSLNILGIQPEELEPIAGKCQCGVEKFTEIALQSELCFFI